MNQIKSKNYCNSPHAGWRKSLRPWQGRGGPGEGQKEIQAPGFSLYTLDGVLFDESGSTEARIREQGKSQLSRNELFCY